MNLVVHKIFMNSLSELIPLCNFPVISGPLSSLLWSFGQNTVASVAQLCCPLGQVVEDWREKKKRSWVQPTLLGSQLHPLNRRLPSVKVWLPLNCSLLSCCHRIVDAGKWRKGEQTEGDLCIPSEL